MQDYYNINVEGSHFDHGSCVVYNDYGQAASDQVLLAEINSTIERIEKTEPLIAKALNELQHAIEEQNKPKISTLIKELTTGTVASIIANYASAALKTFLGI